MPAIEAVPGGQWAAAIGSRNLFLLICSVNGLGKALERTATDDPVAFTKIVAGLMPREMLASVINVNANVDARLVADVQTFAQAYQAWGSFIGAKVPLIEAEAVEEVAEGEDEPAAG